MKPFIPENQLFAINSEARANCWGLPSCAGAKPRTEAVLVHIWNPQCFYRQEAVGWLQASTTITRDAKYNVDFLRLHHGLEIQAHTCVQIQRSWRSGSLVNSCNESDEISYNAQGNEHGNKRRGPLFPPVSELGKWTHFSHHLQALW